MNRDKWDLLKQFTPARLALGRAGSGIPTQALLDFRLAHARARDAVHSEVNLNGVLECHEVESSARNRLEFLKRPDLGRVLSERSKASLQAVKSQDPPDCLVIIGDGLSATAVNLHAAALTENILRRAHSDGFSVGPVVLARQARVALGDEIGEIFGARLAIMLIGERPGLSNVESLGAYLTFTPRKGRVDAERNCVSNICPAGLPLDQAATEIMSLAREAFRYQLTGVRLSMRDTLIAQNNNT